MQWCQLRQDYLTLVFQIFIFVRIETTQEKHRNEDKTNFKQNN